MALTPSTMPSLGSPAPAFTLPEVRTGKPVSLADLSGRAALLVMFICRHCPFVKHVQDELARIGRDYAGRDVAIVAISANDADAYPADSPASLAEMARALDFTFPLCHDATQDVARAYGAACTPDFFVYDRASKLAYRGQLDDSRPGNGVPVTGRDLRAAIDALLAGRAPAAAQKPSIGCNIKWKAGGAPGRGGR
jgi:peroxiredoxin